MKFFIYHDRPSKAAMLELNDAVAFLKRLAGVGEITSGLMTDDLCIACSTESRSFILMEFGITVINLFLKY